MSLLPGHVANFETLRHAVQAGDAALLDCRGIGTGNPVAVICAANRLADGAVEFVPVARLFDGDPYDEVLPPGHPSESHS